MFDQLFEELCDAWHAEHPDTVLVPGDGNREKPRLMLIGEAPGGEEVAQRKPFVGKAGKNLDEFLALAGLHRPDIYVSNVVKIRPSELGPTGRTRNRAPNKQELAFFTPWLLREIDLVQPELLVTLGNTPLQALVTPQSLVGSCHGTWLDSRTGQKLFCLYHPASIIYRRELKAVYEADIQTLKHSL